MVEKERSRSISDLLKHPMANVVVGFLLTGVIGGALTNYYTFKRTQQTHQQSLIQARKEAVTKLTALNAEHLARANQLLNALKAQETPEGLGKLKEQYEAARMRWRTESGPVLMATREVLPAEIYYRFREHLKTQFQTRFLDPLHTCLDEGRRANAEGRPVSPVLDSCAARDLVAGAGRCSEALMDMLYELAGGTIEERDQDWLQMERQQHEARLKEACKDEQ